MSDWQAIATSGGLAPIDLRFGTVCGRRQGGPNAGLLAITAALVSYQRSRGNGCIYLDNWAGRPFPFEGSGNLESPSLPLLPDLDSWREALAASELVGDGTSPTPLVLAGGDRLYLYRFWSAEQTIAAFINSRAAVVKTLPPAAPDLFARLFGPIGEEPDWQAAAALAGLRGTFAVITGGPGTGKTTAVSRMLALLTLLEPGGRIALAAPTGKAASRLGESLQAQLPKLAAAGATTIPTAVKTLHRLLGYAPRQDRFSYDRRRPLPYDTVVVDEASMVDLLLMAALIEALPPHCRLVLLGDHDQLASVDTGQVLGDIMAAAGAGGPHGSDFARDYRLVTGHDLAGFDAAAPALRDAVVRLEKSYRFGAGSGIGIFSRAVRDRSRDQALAVLADPGYADVVLRDPAAPVESALDAVWPHLERYCAAASPAEALTLFSQAQVLCGLRHGRNGVDGLNHTVERRLARAGFDVAGEFYHCRPILVTVNDYRNRLFNGDIGVCWSEGGEIRVYFAGEDGTLRHFPLSRLPRHTSAWAMTVHKNQGSEFDHVLFFLPEASSPLCCRELLYTGVTRARQSLVLVADEAQVRQAVATRAARGSGLAALLGVP